LIVAKGDINLGYPTYFYSDSYCDFEGTVFWAGNNIYYRGGSGHTVHGTGIRLLRMIAGRKIVLIDNGAAWAPNPPLQFDFKFGPPCPPCIVKLGRVR